MPRCIQNTSEQNRQRLWKTCFPSNDRGCFGENLWLGARKIILKENLEVSLSDSQYAFHINSRGIDKGSGFHEIMKRLSILPDDVIAIGDSATDIPLFKISKTSIALGNSSADVQAHATMTVSGHAGDGVIEALDKLAPYLSGV